MLALHSWPSLEPGICSSIFHITSWLQQQVLRAGQDLIYYQPHPANIEFDSPVDQPGLSDLVGGWRRGPALCGQVTEGGEEGRESTWGLNSVRHRRGVNKRNQPCILLYLGGLSITSR